MGYMNFGLKIGVEGEKAFKQSLYDINQSFKVLGSEMKLVESQFDKNDNSVGALSAKNTTSYDIELLKKSDLQAGDNVHIKFDPLGIDVTTRIIAIEYNPYNPYEVSIDVGDYEPDIKDLLVK